jgi:ABC-type lipopolysaccharide export system ATPase subunit
VAGYDVVRQPRQLRRVIGLTGQYASVDEKLSGFENLYMIGRLLDLSRKEAKGRAGGLLERFSLTEAAGRPAGTYSGGMRRRLDLAASMMGQPTVLYLDEPTTGLATTTVDTENGTLLVPILSDEQLTAVVGVITARGITIGSISTELPSLDEVFLSLTGHKASAPQDAEQSPAYEEVAV